MITMRNKKNTYYRFGGQYFCDKCKGCHNELSILGKNHWRYRKK